MLKKIKVFETFKTKQKKYDNGFFFLTITPNLSFLVRWGIIFFFF